ncbi:FAD-dependent oxidoreductase [Raineyella fluvialis]|uniref:FAD-dependent oxidoreductase n=1 Tax=Raineyella fluvialis TaxID=2662261 RepID=A0A5Q2FAH8_9ACTN|nr:FAD-dependent oxidoreductase [Raineyella fluvialis]QGF22364.1 FAD-dependent oxidoreductase [Raineyella fluvialis]
MTEQNWDDHYDLVVLGTGAAGLSASLTAANEGLRVLTLEKSDYYGGTTCYSAGTCWVPGSSYVEAAGLHNDLAKAETYLDALVGERGPKDMWMSYLTNGPTMIDYMETMGVRWIPFPGFVDYYPELEGSGRGYRALEPEPFDGKKLGKLAFSHLRGPVPEFALFGGSLMVRRTEVTKLLHLFDGVGLQRLQVLTTALRLGIPWFLDLLRGWPRGTRMVMGNALIARLYHEYTSRGGTLWLNANTTELVTENGRVTGAVVEYRGVPRRVEARRGVVMAAGGFPASPELRNKYLRGPAAEFTRAADTCTGDTFALAEAAGAILGPQDENGALWFPSSVGYRKDGSLAVFPHIWDRAKPGMIAVNAAGKRFTDEARSYNHFVRGMYESDEAGVPTVPAYLVADHDHMMKYGLGMIYPASTGPLMSHWLKSGYIVRDRTLAGLATKIGVDAAGLEATVERYNADCEKGVDTEFGKGSSEYSPQYGDPKVSPNVNLGPVATGPFYAMAVYPTPLSTGRGLLINPQGQCLDAEGTPVEGLYACGSDAQQVFGVQYPGGGCQVGAGMIFGFLIGKHAAGHPVDQHTAGQPVRA